METRLSCKKLFIALVCASVFAGCRKESSTGPVVVSETNKYNCSAVTAWMDMETRLVKNTPGFTPPVAARAMGYTGLALYEAIVPGTHVFRSAHEAMGLGYLLPATDKSAKYNWEAVANAAMRQMMLYMFENASDANKASIDSLFQASKNNYQGEDPVVVERSVAYGQSVADAIYAWSRSDNGDRAYNNSFPANYIVPTGDGLWEPTPPAFQKIPLLPYWGNNRPFIAADVDDAAMPGPAIPFSISESSDEYLQNMEVYTVKKNLTDDQRAIALFWADGGNTFTPPGHLMNIATQLLRQEDANLTKAAEVYMRMGVAVNDAFIACWKGKYKYNCLRPVTYIRKYIDPNWLPLIATPPFPEYGSGHSTVSGAVAEVLNAMFGNTSFTDHTNEPLGLAARSFNNFYEAAEEAAASRLYGGIHYRNSNNVALLCGKAVGKNVASVRLQ
jgi:hypothetical protein